MGLLEWSLPNKWRKVLDRKSFIPAMHDIQDLINECERIERNEVPFNRDEDDDSDNNKNNKKFKFAKNKNNNKKMDASKMIRQRTGMDGRTDSQDGLNLTVASVEIIPLTILNVV